MEPIVVTLKRGKETKGTHRFEANDAPDIPISTVYIKKTAFANGKVPKAVRLTVEVADEDRANEGC